MNNNSIEKLKLDLSIRAKNGLDFIISACLLWVAITCIWTLQITSYDKGIITFIISSLMLPLAFFISRFLKTEWKIKDNPLQPLGLWLNFAQLFYFPFLVFILLKQPDYFVMTYVIITGAHFFPYAWLYNEKGFAIMAGIISISSLLFGLYLPIESMFYIPLFMSVMLVILAVWIFWSYNQKLKSAINIASSSE